MSNYWKGRFIQEYKRQYERTAAAMNTEMAKQYKIVAMKLEVKLRNLFNEIQLATADGTLLQSDLYKYQHYYELLMEANRLLNNLGEKQVSIMDKQLKNYYKSVCSTVGKSFGLHNTIKNDAVERAVNSIWCEDGKSWSSRIWTDKQLLLQSLEEGITECIATGATTDDMVKSLMRNFNTSFSNAERLVRTEMSHVQNEATLDTYKDAGVDEVEFIDTEDERTCEECQKLDGKVYRILESRGIIPVHCNCRCTWIAHIKEPKNVSNQ